MNPACEREHQSPSARALARGWITKTLYKRAKRELMRLVNMARTGHFPPPYVKRLETKLGIQ